MSTVRLVIGEDLLNSVDNFIRICFSEFFQVLTIDGRREEDVIVPILDEILIVKWTYL